jgi:hypothetical protein
LTIFILTSSIIFFKAKKQKKEKIKNIILLL